MNNGLYSKILSRIASYALPKKPVVPGASLGMGGASRKAGINVGNYTAPKQPSITRPPVKTLDDTKYFGSGAQVSPADFPATGYMGE